MELPYPPFFPPHLIMAMAVPKVITAGHMAKSSLRSTFVSKVTGMLTEVKIAFYTSCLKVTHLRGRTGHAVKEYANGL